MPCPGGSETPQLTWVPHRPSPATVTVSVVSWLTDPDEEWSTDGGRPSRFAEPPASEAAYNAASAASPPNPVAPTGRGNHHSAGNDPTSDGLYDPEDHEDPPKSRLKWVALILGGWVIVSLVVLFVLLAVRGPHRSSPAATGSTSPSASATATALNTPDGWVLAQQDDQTDCAAHSYGLMPSFFAKTPCSGVHRELLTTNQGGRTIVVADYVVSFDTAAQAAAFNVVVKTDGTGNVSDLLREGVKLSNQSLKLSPNAAFISRQDGAQVRVAEAAYTTGVTAPKDPQLSSIAQRAIAE